MKSWVAISFLLVVGVGCASRNAPGAISQPAASATLATGVLKPGDVSTSLNFGGRTRTYITHLPTAISAQQKFPLVIVLHGGGGSAESVARQTGMSAKADKENFIAVYPNGTGRFDDKLLTWNSGNCCGYALDEKVDDAGYLRALILQMQTQYPIDAKKIYATGISNGGMMSYRLACEASDLVAGIALVAGALNNECKPANPVSVIAFHGTADENVPYHGGVGSQRADPHERVDKSVAFAMNFWSSQDRCSPVLQRSEEGNVVRDEYSGCVGNTSVVLYTLKGGGHAWPGGDRMALFLDPPFKEISATNVMWEFFNAHPKQ